MAAADDDVPLLVRVLAGNGVTGAAILACLNAIDATRLRQLHTAVAGVVAGVPWCDMTTAVVDAMRWRAAFPAAVGARVSQRPVGGCLAPLALAGVMHLDLQGCKCVTDELLLRLPASLRTLNVRNCDALTERASVAHLTALKALDCRWASGFKHVPVVIGLPPSLQELDIHCLADGASMAHLARLRVLRASIFDAVTLASLPPSLLELRVGLPVLGHCGKLPPGASFAHLPALHTLDFSDSTIGNASLASLPPSLVSLHARMCVHLTRAAVLPPLPALRLLDVSDTDIGDALVASLPAGLTELCMPHCCGVTAAATLDHVPALRVLHSYNTDLAPGVLAACRARGCAVPAAGVLCTRTFVRSLALLADGRMASGGTFGELQVWDVAAGGDKVCEDLKISSRSLHVLATLRDGHRLAAGLDDGCVVIWEAGVVSPVRTSINCLSPVFSLAVLRDGRLAAGCDDGSVRIIDVDAGVVVATLERHTHRVAALAVLPDGALASGSLDDGTVRVWDVVTRAWVGTLPGHSGKIRALAVLADGRLASASEDRTARLWDVGTRTCVGVLTGHTSYLIALAALPDGRLVSGSGDKTLRVWDTRPAAAAGGRHAAGVIPTTAFACGLPTPVALVPLPDGRLACLNAREGRVQLLHVPPPAPYEALG